MKIAVITLFPDMFKAITDNGISSRACKTGQLDIRFFNPRDYSQDKHKRVDDTPYGGGPGMVMAIQPLEDALNAARAFCKNAKVVFLTPTGKTLQQDTAVNLSKRDELILLNGRYEGIDQRFIEEYVDETISIGDYILTGGELASMVLIDALLRLIPGVLGNKESTETESFNDGLLDHPHYTKPAVYKGKAVPLVLTSGNHQKIAEWRQAARVSQTERYRKDLLSED